MTVEYALVNWPILWQISALVAVMVGIVFIVAGVRMSRRATPSRGQAALLLRRVRGLVPGEDSHAYSAEDIQAVWRQWRGQMGIASRGAGAGVLVGVLVSFALPQLALHAPFSLPIGLFWLLCLPPLWGMLLGFTCGSVIATQQAVSRRIDATVAEPPISHKVLDYRSPLLTVLVAMPAIVYTTLILVAPKYSAFDAFDLRMYFAIHGHALVSPPRWILAIYPGAMWLTVLLVECCAWVRVKSAASITSPDAALARGASMALMGRNLAFIYAPVIMIPAQIVGPGAMMLLLTRSNFALIITAYGSTMLVCSMSMILMAPSEGRMGGWLTGWPWSNGAARGDGAATAVEG